MKAGPFRWPGEKTRDEPSDGPTMNTRAALLYMVLLDNFSRKSKHKRSPVVEVGKTVSSTGRWRYTALSSKPISRKRLKEFSALHLGRWLSSSFAAATSVLLNHSDTVPEFEPLIIYFASW